jgi:hypothetical protein
MWRGRAGEGPGSFLIKQTDSHKVTNIQHHETTRSFSRSIDLSLLSVGRELLRICIACCNAYYLLQELCSTFRGTFKGSQVSQEQVSQEQVSQVSQEVSQVSKGLSQVS